jgi:peptidoglycan/LPS O-acetylase OafA/YrhL
MSSKVRTGATKFFVPLESLRGLAALVVVIYHAVWTNPVTGLHFFQNGSLMVDFFFVLSGFVISHSYGQKLRSATDIVRFLFLRIGRLYPLHLVFLLVFLAFEVAKFVAEKKFGLVADKPAFSVNNGYAFLANLLLIHALGLFHRVTFNIPSWSISTEFYAYVLFAAVRTSLRNERQMAIAAVAIVAASAAILYGAGVIPLDDAVVDWGFLRCCAGFFLGTLTYYAYCAFRSERSTSDVVRPSAWLSPLALVTTAVFLSTTDPAGPWTYALPPLAALVILTNVLWPHPALQKILSASPLRWLGRVSYSLYLVHAAVAWIITQVLTVVLKFPKIEVVEGLGVGTPPLTGLCVLVGYVALVLLLANSTYHWIEEPCRKHSRVLAERWFPDASGIATAPAR